MSVYFLTMDKEMCVSKEFYDRCSPSYQKAIDELEKQINELRNTSFSVNDIANVNSIIKGEPIGKVMINFTKTYLTPKEYWTYWMSFFEKCPFSNEEFKQTICNIANSAYFHLYYNHDWNFIEDNYDRENFLQAYDNKCVKNLEFQNKQFLERGYFKEDYENYVVTENDLVYPHDFLKECFHEFESEASCLPSQKLVKRYNDMCALYQKIKAAKNFDVEIWFKLLLEADDIDFVKDNVECRIGENLLDIKLWKLYLSFLKEHKQYKSLLQTYSKYCRFFLDDFEMLEEYKKDMIIYGPVKLDWNNLFDFEVNNELDETESFNVVETKEVLPLNKNLCSNFYDSSSGQKFSFRQSIIHYILKHANHRILRKLFSSCKYFFAKQPIPICYHLESGSLTEGFKSERITLQSSSNLEMFLKDTFVTGVIDIENLNPHKNYFMSNIIPHLYQCEAKHISLEKQNLTFNELKFLIKHGGVVDLRVEDCVIRDEKGDLIALEEIMSFLPNIEVLCLPKIKSTPNTGHTLAKQKFNSKIYNFYIQTICGEQFDANEFLKFCKANRYPTMFYCSMFFDSEFDADFVQNFENIMENYENVCGNCDIEVDFTDE